MSIYVFYICGGIYHLSGDTPLQLRDGSGDIPVTRKMELSTTPPQSYLLQAMAGHGQAMQGAGQGSGGQPYMVSLSGPLGMSHYTSGLTGRHVLSVADFNKDQVREREREREGLDVLW